MFNRDLDDDGRTFENKPKFERKENPQKIAFGTGFERSLYKSGKETHDSE